MKIKVFKLLKLLISICIICSFVFSSYATIASADGSAFVTKSQFDSSLADFNSRLTSFEAGLNTKIDSQVTAYLDRNGIWSPKEQTLENEGWINIGTWSSAYSGLTITGTNAYNANGYACHKFDDQKIINNITKSGLLFLEGYSRCPGNGRHTREVWYAQGDNTEGQNGYISTIYNPKLYNSSGTAQTPTGMNYFHRGGPFITSYLYVIHKGTTEKVPIAMIQGVAGCGKQGGFSNSTNTTAQTLSYSFLSNYSGYYYVWYRNNYVNTSGFVANGDTVYFHIENGYSGGMYGSTYGLGFSSSNNGYTSMYAIFDITSARVY